MDPEIERLRKKVENYPSPSAYNRLAELLRDSKDYDGVKSVCTRCIREFKRNGTAYIILAEVYINQGNHSDATSLLEDAIKQDPRSAEAFCMLASAHEASGATQDAIACLHKALDLKPGDAEIQERISKVSTSAPSAPAPAGRTDSGTIDMTGMSLSMSSGAASAPAAASEPIAFDAQPRTSAPVNAPAPAPQAKAANPLSALLDEAGVIGVVVADDQGRVVSSEQMADGQETVFAALAHEVSTGCEEALNHLQQAPLANWSVTTPSGLLMAFRRNAELTLLVQAKSDCKIAMIELRARQALIDLGGA